MKIAISAESTIDLPKEQLARFDIHTLPFTLNLGDKSVLDGEIRPEDLFAFTDKTGQLPKTSAVNEYLFIKWYLLCLVERKESKRRVQEPLYHRYKIPFDWHCPFGYPSKKISG